jgi:hypothetical protein
MSEAESVARALGGQRAGRGWIALCPAHDNTRTPALSISEGRDGRLLVKCHAGCAGRDVLAALAARGVITGRSDWRPADAQELVRRRAAEDARRLQRIRNGDYSASVMLWHSGRRPGPAKARRSRLISGRHAASR